MSRPTNPKTLESRTVPLNTGSYPPEKEFSGNLHVRIDREVHRRVNLASTQAGKNLTNWVEEALRNAADDALGDKSDRVDIASPAIRQLIEDPEHGIPLIEAIIPNLKEDNTFFVLRFNAALKKLLIGLDAILPFFQDGKVEIPASSIKYLTKASEPVVQIVAAIAPFLKQEEPSSVQPFIAALKRLLVGLDAVQPFLKDDSTASALEIVVKIGGLLPKI
jgi:uncharacterized protein (DUF1778 family)